MRVFAYDGNGQIISRRDGTANGNAIDQGSDASLKNQHYVYVNGQQIAHYDEKSTVDVLSQVTAFSSGNGTGDYVVQEGDTLKSIAQAVYGNASLWYIVAQANALGGDADLAVGLSLSIPAVTTTKNDSTTYKPYNPTDIQGTTTPNLPVIVPPPPPPKQHCNVVAAIVVIAVTAVVSYYGGAVAGNIAGQLAGDLMGTHHGLSIKEAAIAYVTSSVSEYASDYVTEGTGSLTLGGATGAATSYATNVVASKALNEPTSFSWAGLIGNAAGGAVAVNIGPLMNEQVSGSAEAPPLTSAASYAVQGAVTREVTQYLGGTHVQSWADIVGGAIGAGIGASVRDHIVDYRLATVKASSDRYLTQQSQRITGSLQGGMTDASYANTMAYGSLDSQLAGVSGGWNGVPGQDVGSSGGTPDSLGDYSYTSPPDTSLNRYLVDPSDQTLYVNFPSSNQPTLLPAVTVRPGTDTATSNAALHQVVFNSTAQATRNDRVDSDGVRHASAIDVQSLPWLGPQKPITRAPGLPAVHADLSVHGDTLGPEDLDTSFMVDTPDLSSAAVGYDAPPASYLGGEPDLAARIASNSYSLMAMGRGVGDVDWAGQPTRVGEPSNFSLVSKFSDIWGSDSSLLKKVELTGRLAAYEVPDVGARAAARKEAERAAAQRTARLDQMLNPAFAVPWVTAHILGVSDKNADRFASIGAVLIGVAGSGVATTAARNDLRLSGGMPVVESYAPFTPLEGEGQRLIAGGTGTENPVLSVGYERSLESAMVSNTTAVEATSEVGAGNNGIPPRLYHYTNEAGMQGILDSEALNPSLKAINPNDVRYGNGQYLSDIAPGVMTPAQLSRAFINNPFQGARYTNFIEIDTAGLNVIQGRPGVYVVPNEVPLDLSGRITNSGKVLGQ